MLLKYTPLAAVLLSLQVSAAPAPAVTPTTTPSTQQVVTSTPAAPVADKTAAVVTSSTENTSVAASPAQTPVAATPVVASSAPAPATVQAFTPEQEARIGEVAKAYLLDHPEVLLEVSQKLQVQQREQQLHALTTAALAHQDALLNDPATPSYGPADAKVALVEFFDYQCSVCAQQAPVMEALMQANPKVRYVFKEWPIFAARWPASMDAAETGLQIWRQKGADAYLAYHNALFATGHNEGKLTQQDIARTSAKAGKLKGKKAEVLDTLAQTDALAQNMGLRGTPGLIVMPVSGATVDNVTVVPGGASQETLQAAIDKAFGK
ncbi:TPA: DsbA family protein [Citrobacter freundii]